MRKNIVIVPVLLAAIGCAMMGPTVDKESLPTLQRVAVVSYANNTKYPYLATEVKRHLEDDLYLITKPRFMPYDRCARIAPDIAGLRREDLADPGKRKEVAEALGADAVLFCNIAFASFTEAPEDYEPGGVNIEKVPTGQKGGGEKIKSISVTVKPGPEPRASVSVLVQIISLATGEKVYSVLERSSESEVEGKERTLLTAAAESAAHDAIRKYGWPGLGD